MENMAFFFCSESVKLFWGWLIPVNFEIKIPRRRATNFVAPSIKAHSAYFETPRAMRNVHLQR